MAVNDLVTGSVLGNEFDIGVIEPGLIRLRIDGTSITRAVDGTLSAVVGLNVVTAPLYEYRDLWAEETAGLSDNNNQWSFGNGDVGVIGLPVGDGWEVVEMGFQSDINGANDGVIIGLVDIQTGANNIEVARLTMTAAGNGQANNAHWLQEFAPSVPVPAGAVLGFRTIDEIGTISSARVTARLRRQVGTYVTDVTVL